eukprot:762611-Hanusia_phi.AAC.3
MGSCYRHPRLHSFLKDFRASCHEAFHHQRAHAVGDQCNLPAIVSLPRSPQCLLQAIQRRGPAHALTPVPWYAEEGDAMDPALRLELLDHGVEVGHVVIDGPSHAGV